MESSVHAPHLMVTSAKPCAAHTDHMLEMCPAGRDHGGEVVRDPTLDPMVPEASLPLQLRNSPTGHGLGVLLDGLGDSSPELERVNFPEAANSPGFSRLLSTQAAQSPSANGLQPTASQPSCASLDPAALDPSPTQQQTRSPASPPDFVTTERGSEPQSMAAGVIPSSPSAFAARVTRPLQNAICSSPVQRRRRASVAPPRTPRRSSRLAKKSLGRTPAVQAAQNVLLKKLGITDGAPPVAQDLEAYVQMFQQGLSEEHTRLIADLFADRVPLPSDSVVADEELQ